MSATGTLLTLCALAATAFSQNSTSTLDGFVKDPQGALIPNAGVTVINVATGQSVNTVTDDHGHWAVPSLAGGTYSVSVSSLGFKKATVGDARMDAGIPATVNITLEVGVRRHQKSILACNQQLVISHRRHSGLRYDVLKV